MHEDFMARFGQLKNRVFVERFYEMSKAINANAQKKGFWENPVNLAEKIALMHSELSEALEAIREEG